MFATYTSQEMKGFLMPGSKSSENILSCFCPVAFVILIENLVQTLTTVQKHSVYRQTIPILSLLLRRPNNPSKSSSFFSFIMLNSVA